MDKRRRAKKSVLVMIAMIALLVSAQAAQAGWTRCNAGKFHKDFIRHLGHIAFKHLCCWSGRGNTAL